MELKQITHFIALSKFVSFTKAAEACNISQPAFSQSIRKLEEELGGALIHRDGRNSRLTPLGAVLLAHFERLQSAENELKSAARRETVGDRMRLRVHVEHISCLAQATRAAQVFMNGSGDVSVLVTTDGAADDAAFDDTRIVFSNAPPATNGGFARELAPEKFVAIFPKDHALAGVASIAPERFFAERLIRWHGCPLLRTLEDLAAALGMSPDFRLTASDFFLAKHFVAAGFGATMGPESLAEGDAIACAPLDADPIAARTYAHCEFAASAKEDMRAHVAAFFASFDA